jgi:molecular chaperone GrpE
VGEPFDPNEHEAVSHEPAEGDGDGGAEPVVSGLMRAGYRWKGRLVRAAMVTVRG